MTNHFEARVAISRLQRLKTHTPSHPGRCPGLLHFAPWRWGPMDPRACARGYQDVAAPRLVSGDPAAMPVNVSTGAALVVLGMVVEPVDFGVERVRCDWCWSTRPGRPDHSRRCFSR